MNSDPSSDTILDPCLPKDLKLAGQPFQPPSASQYSKQPHTLVGIGSFERCLEKTSSLHKDAPCSALPCLFNGVHVPPIDFSVSHFACGFVFYIFMFAVFGTIMWRLRSSLRITCKRVTRYASRGRYGNGGSTTGRKFTTESYAMEEGHAGGGVSTSPRSSPRSSLSSSRSGSTFKPLQRFNLGLLPGSSTLGLHPVKSCML